MRLYGCFFLCPKFLLSINIGSLILLKKEAWELLTIPIFYFNQLMDKLIQYQMEVIPIYTNKPAL